MSIVEDGHMKPEPRWFRRPCGQARGWEQGNLILLSKVNPQTPGQTLKLLGKLVSADCVTMKCRAHHTDDCSEPHSAAFADMPISMSCEFYLTPQGGKSASASRGVSKGFVVLA